MSNPEPGKALEHMGRPAKVIRLMERVDNGADDLHNWECCVGIFRTPEEFAQDISALKHPIDQDPNLHDVILSNISWNLKHSAAEVSKHRLRVISEMRETAGRLVSRDKELKAKVPSRARSIVGNKSLALLEHYIKKLNWPDKDLINDLVDGFRLSGTMKPSGVFPQKVKLASITREQLQSSSKWCRKAVLAKMSSSGDSALDSKLWEQVLGECDKKWCRGPYTEDQVTSILGHDNWLCNRRFGLQQKSKVRDIDDYSEAGPNDTITTVDKLDLHDVDDAATILKTIHSAISGISEDGTFSIKSMSGKTHTGKLSPTITVKQSLKWVGKTFDLKSAYKNLFTADDDSWFTIISVWNPNTSSFSLFLQDALPFGATGSVIAFNRCARLLWAIAAFELRVIWLSYFDDFPTFERSDTAEITDIAIRAMHSYAYVSVLGGSFTLEGRDCFTPHWQLGGRVLIRFASQRTRAFSFPGLPFPHSPALLMGVICSMGETTLLSCIRFAALMVRYY